MISTVLIANRGEIACRIIRACRALNLRTVAVYSEADAQSLHKEMADVALPIGPAPAAQSYLDAHKILQAGRDAGADAVHPGYGFLSENTGFARAARAAGMTWIGPDPATIDAMGDKARSRQIAQASGVPVLECRLYAENPAKNFLPSPGTLTRFELPTASTSLRVDCRVREGDQVTPFYDPMVAKLIAFGSDRGVALRAMDEAALRVVRIEGIRHNTDFLRAVLAREAFADGRVDTGFVERERAALTSATETLAGAAA